MKPLTLALICLGIVALRWRRAVRVEGIDDSEAVSEFVPMAAWLPGAEPWHYERHDLWGSTSVTFPATGWVTWN